MKPEQDDAPDRTRSARINSEVLRQWKDQAWDSSDLEPVCLSFYPEDRDTPSIDPRTLLPEGDPYTLGWELGRGGMGTVVAARDNRLGRTVALKQLISDKPNSEVLRRFLQEAQVTGQLDHPNVINVHEVSTDAEGRLFYTMQLVRGSESLREAIGKLKEGEPRAHRRYSMERRVQIIQQVCNALHYAHRKGVIHRDIKPGNIMVGPFGEVLLLDWGLARVRTNWDQFPEPIIDTHAIRPGIDPIQTDPETVLGTLLYMAPEQVQRSGPSEASDIYSLSAVLFEFLSLKHYLGDWAFEYDLERLVPSIVDRVPLQADADSHLQNGRVPADLARICAKGLSKDPSDRYESAQELAQDLQRWLEGCSPVTNCNTCFIGALNFWKRLSERYPMALNMVTMAAMIVFLVGAVRIVQIALSWL